MEMPLSTSRLSDGRIATMTVANEGCTRQPNMKRSRRWYTTAIVLIASALVDMDTSAAFSPTSDIRASQNSERRRSAQAIDARTSDDNANKWISVSGTDLNIAMSAGMLGIYEGPAIGGTKEPKKQGKTKLHQPTNVSANSIGIASSSHAVSLGKGNRNALMVRSKNRNSSSRVGSMTVALDHSGLLDSAQERKLTVSIRSLRRAVRVRDELVERIDSVPSEGEWAAACSLSVIGLRRVLYEGQQARTVLVSANAGLVTAIAKRQFSSLKYATEAGGGVGTILTIQDLIQEGNLGLMQAAERFEADRGHRFSTYATYWIKQRILRAISDSSRIIRLPAHGTFHRLFLFLC
jgi:Sigma-70 region 2